MVPGEVITPTPDHDHDEQEAEAVDTGAGTVGGAGWVCPECGEPVVPVAPAVWTSAWGLAPGWSHLDGQPLCPVVGPAGYQPADPVTDSGDDGPVPGLAPGLGGGPGATSGGLAVAGPRDARAAVAMREEAMAGNTAGGRLDVMPIAAGELTGVSDLDLQAADAVQVAEVAQEYLDVLSTWATGLADRYAAAGFATAGLSSAVAAVVEAIPANGVLVPISEALAMLTRETENTLGLAESAEALDASGDLAAFRTT